MKVLVGLNTPGSLVGKQSVDFQSNMELKAPSYDETHIFTTNLAHSHAHNTFVNSHEYFWDGPPFQELSTGLKRGRVNGR